MTPLEAKRHAWCKWKAVAEKLAAELDACEERHETELHQARELPRDEYMVGRHEDELDVIRDAHEGALSAAWKLFLGARHSYRLSRRSVLPREYA